VNWDHLLHGFYLDNDCAFDKQVELYMAIQDLILVLDRYVDLTLDRESPEP